jgi:hypothetical protein
MDSNFITNTFGQDLQDSQDFFDKIRIQFLNVINPKSNGLAHGDLRQKPYLLQSEFCIPNSKASNLMPFFLRYARVALRLVPSTFEH